MKWTNDRSDNVDDRRGLGGGGMAVGGGLEPSLLQLLFSFWEAILPAILSGGGSPQQSGAERT